MGMENMGAKHNLKNFRGVNNRRHLPEKREDGK